MSDATDGSDRADQPLLLDRRHVVGGIVAAGLYAGMSRAEPAAPIVSTHLGKVRGTRERGVAVFKGIPYAASTGGTNRFRPPQPAAPWTGVREADRFGSSAPQALANAPERAAFGAIEPLSEDCLTLNVYTPGVHSNARRPVMVWLHGGAWRAGAGSSPGLRGIRLAREGNVVLVTINHRLDVLGFLKIDDGDERFVDSGNAGVLDMIAALRWVRDNAGEFGGDPGNVTIFGQSGGGSKVSALMAAPAARGLFHKAIAMSCSGCLRLTGQEEADALSASVARNLGLPRISGAVLQSMPFERIVAAAGGRHRPIVDQRTFTRHAFDPDAPASAVNIPLLIGNVATETRIMMAAATPDNFRLDEAEATRRVARFLHIDADKARDLMAGYRGAYPGDTPSDLLAAIASDYSYVRNTRRMADLQAAQAPVYSYLFVRRSPVMNGLLRAPHEADVPFVFGTANTAENMVGRGRDIEPLTALMIATWSRFAHTGNPNNPHVPHWPRHRADGPSMLLDVPSRVGPLPGSEARHLLGALPFYEYSMPTSYTHA